MQTDLTRSTPQRSDPDRLGPSTLARVRSRGTSERTVAALSLRERLLLSLGIQAACVAIRAADHGRGLSLLTGHLSPRVSGSSLAVSCFDN